MASVRLIHWNAAEAVDGIAALEGAGYEVDCAPLDTQTALKRIAACSPEAIAIDLSRRPGQGRDLALWLRQQKKTRFVPLVLLGGAEDSVRRLQDLLPDATYSSWEDILRSLGAAIVEPPLDPVVPESVFAGYSGTPLPKKLGIKPGFVVALLAAPGEFEQTLGPLPPGVTLRPSGRGRRDLTICFVRSRAELGRRMSSLLKASEQGHVWIAWPKKTSGLDTDLTQNEVRQRGLAAGLVDFKICAIDETWSGLCFARRRH